MTAFLVNALGPVADGAQRTPGRAPAILDAHDSGRLLRFGEAMRAQASEGSVQPAGNGVAGGGLLATRSAAPDLHIDDADILKQFAETNFDANVVARPRVTAGAKDAQSDDPDAADDKSEPAVVLVPPAPDAVNLASVPVTIVPLNAAGATNVARAVVPARDTKDFSVAASPALPAQRSVMTTAGMPLTIDTGSDLPLASASIALPSNVARASDASLIAMNAATPGDQQGSNLLASQSQPLLVAMASSAAEARAAGTHKVADVQPAATSRQSLIDALGERLNVQLNRGSSQATIRLDPPMMGTIQIVIRHDAAGVQVHLSATHGDVLRQLHSIGNALSHDLTQRNQGEVTVHVSGGSRDGDGRQRDRHGGSADSDSAPGHALRTVDESERAVTFTLA